MSAAKKQKSIESQKEDLTEPTGRDSGKGDTGSGKHGSGEQPMETEGAVEEGDMLKELGEEEEEEKSSGDELPPGGVVVCTEGMATRIHRVIVKSVLPQLHKCLTHKVWRRGGGGGWRGVGGIGSGVDGEGGG